MKKLKVGILTFSDEREYIHKEMLETNIRYQRDLEKALKKKGEFEVITGNEIIGTSNTAKKEGMRLAKEGVDLTIFNYAIWCYPHLSIIAANFAPGPYLLFCNLHPAKCGMVGMLAAAGALDQIGKNYTRVWGDIRQKSVLEKVISYIKAVGSVLMLKGQTFGSFGGRPLGMYTAVSNLDQWQRIFGIDIEYIEQYEIMRYSEKVEMGKVKRARKWLEQKAMLVGYNGKNLTPEKFGMQIRSYYALKKIILERNLDFLGIKSIGDLTDYFVTMDIAEAFLNDPYDWDGPHKPIIAATECDMDGALTMQLFKHLTGEPVLFSDVRHYDKEDDVWYLSNSGAHPTYFAGRSKNPDENMKYVSFKAECSDYPAGGASVHHYAAPGKVTLARLARKEGKYWMAIVPGEIIEFPREIEDAKGATVTPEWPIAFTRLNVNADDFLAGFPCNHIHGVYGEYVSELLNIAKVIGIEAKVFL